MLCKIGGVLSAEFEMERFFNVVFKVVYVLLCCGLSLT